MPLPDEAGRAAILAVHMREVPLARELDQAAVCELISKMTRGTSQRFSVACTHCQADLLRKGVR